MSDFEDRIMELIDKLDVTGQEVLLRRLTKSWAATGKKLMDEAEAPEAGFDSLSVITSMFQVHLVTEVSLALDAAHSAIKRYNLTDMTLNLLAQADGEVCGHDECEQLRKARSNPDMN